MSHGSIHQAKLLQSRGERDRRVESTRSRDSFGYDEDFSSAALRKENLRLQSLAVGGKCSTRQQLGESQQQQQSKSERKMAM